MTAPHDIIRLSWRRFWKNEYKAFLVILATFLCCFFLPSGSMRFNQSLIESFQLAKWYAREHVLLCLVPAFFIAGAISIFVSQASVIKYFGAMANKALAYGVASVSGTILAVCSCTVLPLFAGIYRMGAGIGPATAFLYSGPAINVLAIVLTARVLGIEMGIARALGAIVFSVVIGLTMHFIFRKEKSERTAVQANAPAEEAARPLWKTSLYFAAMVWILVFANWGKPQEPEGAWHAIYSAKWTATSIGATALGVILACWFGFGWIRVALIAAVTAAVAILFPSHPSAAFGAGAFGLTLVASAMKGEAGDWLDASWGFAKQILPFLLLGVLAAGLLFGRPGHEGLIPSDWVAGAVGGNSLSANLFASIAGSFMYFATLTEIPILEGLLGAGMGKGPALALLLAGPALSLPNMLVIQSVIGAKKTSVFVALVIVMSAASGIIYGHFFN